jgi:adenylate cyclase
VRISAFWISNRRFGPDAECDRIDNFSNFTGLSRFSYLRVIARGSTLRYAHEATDLRAVGKELGARYVIEGNLRQAELKMRLAVQLIDTTNGVQL